MLFGRAARSAAKVWQVLQSRDQKLQFDSIILQPRLKLGLPMCLLPQIRAFLWEHTDWACVWGPVVAHAAACLFGGIGDISCVDSPD